MTFESIAAGGQALFQVVADGYLPANGTVEYSVAVGRFPIGEQSRNDRTGWFDALGVADDDCLWPDLQGKSGC